MEMICWGAGGSRDFFWESNKEAGVGCPWSLKRLRRSSWAPVGQLIMLRVPGPWLHPKGLGGSGSGARVRQWGKVAGKPNLKASRLES
jgi:hypothetical protein